MQEKKIIFINPRKRKNPTEDDASVKSAASINTFLYLQRLIRNVDRDYLAAALDRKREPRFSGFAKQRPKI